MSGGRPAMRSVLLAAALCCGALAMPAGASAAFAPLASYGSGALPTDGAGHLDNPGQVAVDGSGNVFVAETANNRISEFAADGSFVRAWGYDVDPAGGSGFEFCTTASGCQVGSGGGGAGELSSPFGLALDGAGNLYVAETGNDRVSQFTTDGAFVQAFGFDVNPGGGAGLEVCTVATTCQPGLNGAAAGELSFPEGVAADGAGNLDVVDNSNNRIAQFTSGGAFVRAWGWDVDPAGGSGFEICTTATGCQAGLFGAGAGQFNGADEAAADGAGNLYVADRINNRVEQFASSGTFVRGWGYGVDTGAPALETCTAASTCQAGIAGPGAGQLNRPVGVAADGAGNVYVAEQTNNRASQFTVDGGFVRAWGYGVDTGAAAFEVCTTASGCQIGIDGTGAGQFSEPWAAATDCRGAAYILDNANANIQRFGEEGTPAPPCPPAGPVAKPSNEFSFGKLKRNKHKGTAKLTVIVPGPGTLTLAGHKVKPVKKAGRVRAQRPAGAVGGGKAILPISARGKAKRKLNGAGTAKVKFRVTYTPTGGDPNAKPKRIKLVKLRRR